MCLNARSIINKKTELNIMVDDIKPHIIGITESWANNDITDAELGLEGYVMFRKDRMGRRGGGVLLYIKETIPAYEVQLQEEADCKEALNAATNEVRKSKRNFEHKLAQNIKSDRKSFYAYVRSKQNVRDKVGPLVDNAGNIIPQGFLMAEELNMHFSSVFTREDTSSIPVPETKFKGSEGERLGQLVVTPRSSS